MRVGVHKLAMNSPSDVSALERLIDAGVVDPAEIVALIGKTEGNGGANDFTRGFATLSFTLAIAKRLKLSPEEVAKRVAFVWSGGTEGVLSPHATLFTKSSAAPQSDGKRRRYWQRWIEFTAEAGPYFVSEPFTMCPATPAYDKFIEFPVMLQRTEKNNGWAALWGRDDNEAFSAVWPDA